MRLQRTIRLPLGASPVDVLPTMDAYTKAFNFVCQVGWKDSDSNGVSLHHKTYYECRERFGLPSQLACSARAKATEALLSVKARARKGKRTSCPKSRSCPIRLDARTYTIWFDRNLCSITTIGGRKRFGVKVPKYYEQFLSWKQASADLLVRDDKVFLHLVLRKEVEDPEPNGEVLGMDAGIKRIAVTNGNHFFGGGRLSHVSNEYKRKRRTLQKKGHSGKRHLNRLGRKENRFVRDTLHVVSKKIVSSLEPGDSVAMEDLNGIRDRTKLGRKARTMLNSWAFSVLQSMVRYKAEAKGCLVLMVDPRHTSQRCSKCGHVEKSNRKSQSRFECKGCHFTLNADLNASRNIAFRGEMLVAKRGQHGLPPTSLMLPSVSGSSKPSRL